MWCFNKRDSKRNRTKYGEPGKGNDKRHSRRIENLKKKKQSGNKKRIDFFKGRFFKSRNQMYDVLGRVARAQLHVDRRSP